MLTDTAYGKSGIRLVQVRRRNDRHDLRDLTIAVRFQGEYDASYVEGDNSAVLPTDTMKNTVYALAAEAQVEEPEPFGLLLARRFLDHNPRLHRVRIDVVDHTWGRITVGDHAHGQAFVRQGSDTRSARIDMDRRETLVWAGVADLRILKSSQSGFAGFPRDEYTTLVETGDRLLVTSLTATWRYRGPDIDFGPTWQVSRRALVEAFASHDSRSVQHTLHATGQAVLDRVPEVAAIRLVMPNKHHVPIDLSPFGIENRNEIFEATEEPHGLFEATITRASPPAI